MTVYTLPDLDYDYGGLEPHVSGHIMELHHDKHHATYVEKANQALAHLEESRRDQEFSAIVGLEKALAFNVSGHVLHSLFWKNLSPHGGERPDGALADAIQHHCGGFDAMKAQMTQAAATLMGSGWAALVWEPMGQRLQVLQIYDHQANVTQGGVPLLVLDGWEHAYYLQYKTDKAAFLAALWKVVNWQDVAARFESARTISLVTPAGAYVATRQGRG
jgi:Fe-Mn family superoxide dismutase